MSEENENSSVEASDEPSSDEPMISPTKGLMPGGTDAKSQENLAIKSPLESLRPTGFETSKTTDEGGHELDGVAKSENLFPSMFSEESAYTPEKAVEEVSKALEKQDALLRRKSGETPADTRQTAPTKRVKIHLADSDERELFGSAGSHMEITPTDKGSYFIQDANNAALVGNKRTIEATEPLLHEDGSFILKRDQRPRYVSKTKKTSRLGKKQKKSKRKSKKTKRKNSLLRHSLIKKRNFIHHGKSDVARERKRVLSIRSLFKRFLDSRNY